jgi:hypothetical protein
MSKMELKGVAFQIIQKAPPPLTHPIPPSRRTFNAHIFPAISNDSRRVCSAAQSIISLF